MRAMTPHRGITREILHGAAFGAIAAVFMWGAGWAGATALDGHPAYLTLWLTGVAALVWCWRVYR